MSVIFSFFVFLTVIVSPLHALAINWPPKITVSIDSKYENEPLQGSVKIIHLVTQKIDPSTFTLDNKPITLQFVGDENPEGAAAKMDEGAIVQSTYSFALPARAKGLYLFGKIGVKVGDNYYTTPPISYEIMGKSVSDELGLEVRIVENGTIFVGQTVTFEYRISFRQPTQLTKEELPLLQFEGFRNTGAPQITTAANGTDTVQTIRQQAVAMHEGTFHSGASRIEGFVYTLDDSGAPKQASAIFQADAPDIVVNVLPFPATEKPISFNGAIGVYHWQVAVNGKSSVTVGEKIRLQIFVSGTGDLATVQVPDLSKQSAFKNSFAIDDLAPVGEIREGTKRFYVELRPLNDRIKEIPAIEFSSFDPISKTYVIKKSAPIPITVRSSGNSTVRREEKEQMRNAALPIEIQGNMELQESELETKNLESIILLYALLSLAAVLIIELIMKRLTKETSENTPRSRELFLESIKKRRDPSVACPLISRALLLALYEQKITKQELQHPEELSNDGMEGEIKKLLEHIEQKRFTGLEAQVEMNEIIKEATVLYHRLTNS